MKKIITILILFLLLFTSSQTYASNGLIKPTSRFYFLQVWGESAKLFLIRSPEQKINYLLELTNRRVVELKTNPSNQVSNRYEKHFENLGAITLQVSNKERVSEEIKEASLAQQQILAKVYNQVSEEAQGTILDVQENSSKHVVKAIEAVEGSQKAREYADRVIQIQQAEKMGQVEKSEQVPMEDSPNSDPSQNAAKELKGTNPLKEGQQLNILNPQGAGGNGNGSRMEPAAPVQMDQPAGQN